MDEQGSTREQATILARLEEMEKELRTVLHPDQAEAIHAHTMRVARQAFVYGVNYGTNYCLSPHTYAQELFPLPPLKVLREEPDPMYPNTHWRWRNGVLEFWCEELPYKGWRPLSTSGRSYEPLPDRIRLWADLLAKPYREEPQ